MIIPEKQSPSTIPLLKYSNSQATKSQHAVGGGLDALLSNSNYLDSLCRCALLTD